MPDSPTDDAPISVELPSRRGAEMLERMLREQLDAAAASTGRRRAEPSAEDLAVAADLRLLCDALREQLT